MADLSSASFDEWYSDINATDAFDAQVRRGLDLPAGLVATGLVSGPAFMEVVRALALSPGEVLLDLACGRGGYGLAAAQSADARLVGVDFSAVAVNAARSAAAELGMAERTSFVVGDLTATGLESASVNAVMCLDSIQFAAPIAAAVGECRRVLVPEGRLVVTCWEAADSEAAELPERLRHLDLGAALREGGFVNVSVLDRPSWLDLERCHWEAAGAVEPNGDAGLAALREEAEELLPVLPLMRRVLATATAPATGTT